jgi:hypothetical protein
VKEWADALLFGNWKTQVAEKDNGKERLVGGKTRVLFCNRSAAYDAKNRYGLKDEEGWNIATISKGFAAIGAPWEMAAPEAAAKVRRDEEPDADVIPGFPDPEVAELEKLLGKHEGVVNAFLVTRGEIREGQTFREVTAAYRKRILTQPVKFLNAATARLVAA